MATCLARKHLLKFFKSIFLTASSITKLLRGLFGKITFSTSIIYSKHFFLLYILVDVLIQMLIYLLVTFLVNYYFYALILLTNSLVDVLIFVLVDVLHDLLLNSFFLWFTHLFNARRLSWRPRAANRELRYISTDCSDQEEDQNLQKLDPPVSNTNHARPEPLYGFKYSP